MFFEQLLRVFGLNHSTRESVEQLISFVAQYADEKYSTWPFSFIHPPILFGTPLDHVLNSQKLMIWKIESSIEVPINPFLIEDVFHMVSMTTNQAL